MAVWVCYDIAKKNLRYNIVMIVLATAELYGGAHTGQTFSCFSIESGVFTDGVIGFITFCPEWLVGNVNLDTSNFMYKWVYLVFFNMLWVWIPLYAIYVGCADILDAFKTRAAATGAKKIR